MTARASLSEPTSSSPPSSRPRAVTGPRAAMRVTKTRSTQVLYAACAGALEDERVIWDVGCGDGQGTRLLGFGSRTVVGIDPDVEVLKLARLSGETPTTASVTFTSTPPAVTDATRAPDLIIVSDVLGYTEQPDLLLLRLSECAKPSTTLLLWEPKSEPTQQLPPGKHRAFSPHELGELAALGGWQSTDSSSVGETFTCLTLTRGPEHVVRALSHLASNSTEPEPIDLTGVSPELTASAHLWRARVSLHARDGNATTSHLLAVLDAQPKHSEALCGLAQLALGCGSVADALHFVRTCLDADPTNVAAMQLWVHFLESAGVGEHINGYQTLANLNPADATVLSTLAQLHAQNGEPLLAIQDLERLRRYHPQPSLDLSLTLGWLLQSVGRKSDAEVEARLASLLDPDGPDVKELLAALAAG